MEDAEELDTIEPSLDSPVDVEDITVMNPNHKHVSCCVNHTEDTPAPIVLKPKLVIGLDQTGGGHLKSSGDASDLDIDNDFVNLDDEIAKVSSLNRSTVDEVIQPSTLG